MVFLIAGASHTGKTLLAQRLLEKYHYPCLSIDHLKMGLIRSGQTALTPMDDGALTGYLWPILREMIRTVLENRQNLILEGCYIPFDWQKDFSPEELSQIRYLCLVMSPEYIRNHFDSIISYENVIEQRLFDSGLTPESLITENQYNLEQCLAHGCPYCLVEDGYRVGPECLGEV